MGMPIKRSPIAKPPPQQFAGSSSASKAGMRRATRARSEILDLILSGQLEAGAPLQERQLAEALGMSRTPVRDALGHLEAESVIARQGKTLIVRQISVREIAEVMAIREQLETYAAEKAAGRINLSEIEALSKRLRALREVQHPSADEHWETDDAVHELVWRGSGNAVLGKLIHDLRLRTRIFDFDRVPERLGPGCDEHLALLEALAKGDADAASAAMRIHIKNACQGIFDNLFKA